MRPHLDCETCELNKADRCQWWDEPLEVSQLPDPTPCIWSGKYTGNIPVADEEAAADRRRRRNPRQAQAIEAKRLERIKAQQWEKAMRQSIADEATED